MKGTRESLRAMIGELAGTGKIRRRILEHILPLMLTVPRRINFSQLSQWSDYNETTLHHWFAKPLAVQAFNEQLIRRYGSGAHVVLFDPSFVAKSGKNTPSLGRFWSGQAQAPKRGLELACFAVGDLRYHTAFHLQATYTPSSAQLQEKDSTLMAHYVEQVRQQQATIQRYDNCLVADGYFGIRTFLAPVTALGITVVTCLRANAALFYPPAAVVGKRPKGRPAVKGAKLNWSAVNDELLPIVTEDAEKTIRCGTVYAKCLKRLIRLAAVEYKRADGTLLTRKLYCSTRLDVDATWILERYGIRFQIEFIFRDAKQFTGLTHCQSTNQTKLENHANLALTAVSVAKVEHWLDAEADEQKPFSLRDIKTYYHNLALLERFSEALQLDATLVKNNPKIKELLLSTSYADLAA
jgi:hypothetical protein